MYDRILVPLDGSNFSEEVIPYAEGLAAVHGTALALLRVVDKESERDEATRYAEHLAAAHGASGHCAVAAGHIADAILEEARRVPRTLIAMTSNGRSGLMEAMLGSVAMSLVRGGGAPVLVYRPTGRMPDDTPVKVRSVVLPLDGSDLSEAMIPDAAALAKWIGAEVLVVSVIDPRARADAGVATSDVLESSYVRSMADKIAAQHGARVNWEVLHGEPADAISAFTVGRRDAVLAMMTHGRRALESAFLGSVTSGCLRRAGVPVLMRAP
ncbi:MAG: universal stress protein [Proteobacteria bacterium]|nr:universal stress protein [Pseudomonadota bacterium]